MFDELLYLLVLIFLPILIIIFFSSPYLNPSREEDCYEFYKSNGYVLDYCKKYEDKLRSYSK